MNSAKAIAPHIGIAAACIGLGVARATFYRAQRPVSVQQANVPRASSPRALSVPEQHTILEWLHQPAYADLSPRTVFAMLLDAGRYLASVSTFYRLLRASGETRGRRNELTHPAYAKPELLATGPRELWSWDITKLKGPAKWVCFHLYVILDVFSRYVIGWMIAPRESAELADELIAATCDKEGIVRGQLTLHADRGTSMRSKPVALLLADLGVTRSHSRPHVSDDNPYSEAQFKTLKYQPDFPARFDSIENARAFCQGFFAWYNHAHRHSGIGYMTPAAVHTGQASRLYAARQQVLDQAFVTHPERFTRRHPTPPALPVQVGINLPKPPPCVPGEAQRSTLNSTQLVSEVLTHRAASVNVTAQRVARRDSLGRVGGMSDVVRWVPRLWHGTTAGHRIESQAAGIESQLGEIAKATGGGCRPDPPELISALDQDRRVI